MISNKENKLSEIFLEGWRPYGWITLVIFLVYCATLFFNIVYLDDNVLVTGQYQFNQSLANLPQAFNEDIFRTPMNGGTFYRPILRLTFILDAQFGQGAIIFMSHLSNLLLHILAICLLFKFLLKLNLKKQTALLFALIFGVHPLTAQTVAFISGRNDSLLAIFIFLALIFFLDFLRTQERKYFVWQLVFFALALFTKETTAVLPAICGSYLLIFVGWKKIIEDYKFYLKLGFSWIVVVAIWFLIRRSVLHNFIGNADYDILQSIYNNLPALISAIGKIFLPFNLSVFPVMRDMSMTYGLISLVLLAIWFFWSEKANIKLISFGLLWFLIFIVLTLIKPLDTVPEFSENRIYLPMFGFIFVILGLGWIKLPKLLKDKIDRKKIILFFSLLIILIFSAVTIYRNRYYKDRLSFWNNAVETSPSFAFNHNNLGAMHYLDGDMVGAEKEFDTALELNPNEKMAHNNLGLVYANQSRLQEAEDEYKKELAINPYYENAYFNLGLLYYKEEKYPEAESSWKKTLEINPGYSDALYNLAVFYYSQKRYDEAARYANEIYRRGLPLPNELQQFISQPSAFLQTAGGK